MKWSVRRANCKRFTRYGRLTESAQEQEAGVCGEPLSMAHGQTHVQRSVGSKPSFSSFFQCGFFEFLWGEAQNKNTSTQNTSTVTALKHSPPSSRLGPTASTQTHANVKRTGSFPDTAEEYAPDVSLQGRIPRSAGTPCNSFLLSTAPCKSSRARVRRIVLSAD